MVHAWGSEDILRCRSPVLLVAQELWSFTVLRKLSPAFLGSGDFNLDPHARAYALLRGPSLQHPVFGFPLACLALVDFAGLSFLIFFLILHLAAFSCISGGVFFVLCFSETGCHIAALTGLELAVWPGWP